MPDDAQVCPQCAAPVTAPSNQAAAKPGEGEQKPTYSSPWLNVPSPQQTPAQPAYTPQVQYYPRQYQQTDALAVVSMILGIASIALCLSIIGGIPAIILGHLSRKKITQSRGALKGDGMALTGLILGYMSLGFAVIFAAYLIPNFSTFMVGANEGMSVTTVRTIYNAEVGYKLKYPDHGYAQDLSTLGPGPTGRCAKSAPEHACLLAAELSGPQCTAGVWCQKWQTKFTVAPNCTPANAANNDDRDEENAGCRDFVIASTPANTQGVRHSFCMTSEGVLRRHLGAPLQEAPTAEECRSWPQYGR